MQIPGARRSRSPLPRLLALQPLAVNPEQRALLAAVNEVVADGRGLVACVWAAFDPDARRLASVVVAISMLSFLLLYLQSSSPPALRRIAFVDLVGLIPLAYVAFWAFRTA